MGGAEKRLCRGHAKREKLEKSQEGGVTKRKEGNGDQRFNAPKQEEGEQRCNPSNRVNKKNNKSWKKDLGISNQSSRHK